MNTSSSIEIQKSKETTTENNNLKVIEKINESSEELAINDSLNDPIKKCVEKLNQLQSTDSIKNMDPAKLGKSILNLFNDSAKASGKNSSFNSSIIKNNLDSFEENLSLELNNSMCNSKNFILKSKFNLDREVNIINKDTNDLIRTPNEKLLVKDVESKNSKKSFSYFNLFNSNDVSSDAIYSAEKGFVPLYPHKKETKSKFYKKTEDCPEKYKETILEPCVFYDSDDSQKDSIKNTHDLETPEILRNSLIKKNIKNKDLDKEFNLLSNAYNCLDKGNTEGNSNTNNNTNVNSNVISIMDNKNLEYNLNFLSLTSINSSFNLASDKDLLRNLEKLQSTTNIPNEQAFKQEQNDINKDNAASTKITSNLPNSSTQSKQVEGLHEQQGPYKPEDIINQFNLINKNNISPLLANQIKNIQDQSKCDNNHNSYIYTFYNNNQFFLNNPSTLDSGKNPSLVNQPPQQSNENINQERPENYDFLESFNKQKVDNYLSKSIFDYNNISEKMKALEYNKQKFDNNEGKNNNHISPEGFLNMNPYNYYNTNTINNNNNNNNINLGISSMNVNNNNIELPQSNINKFEVPEDQNFNQYLRNYYFGGLGLNTTGGLEQGGNINSNINDSVNNPDKILNNNVVSNPNQLGGGHKELNVYSQAYYPSKNDKLLENKFSQLNLNNNNTTKNTCIPSSSIKMSNHNPPQISNFAKYSQNQPNSIEGFGFNNTEIPSYPQIGYHNNLNSIPGITSVLNDPTNNNPLFNTDLSQTAELQSNINNNYYPENLNFGMKSKHNSLLMLQMNGISLNNILALSKEQVGCRKVQKLLEENSEIGSIVLFPQLKSNLYDVIIDQFGNYLVQKMIETLTKEQLNDFVGIVTPDIKPLSNNQFGTRVLQKLIDFLDEAEIRTKFIQAFDSKILLSIILNSQGNHVISKLISKYPADELRVFQDTFEKNTEIITKDKYGCCVIQRMIEHSAPEFREKLISNLMEKVEKYIHDPFANYVLQLSVTYNYKSYNNNILLHVKNNFIYYALEKFSSNVIEKTLSFSDESVRNEIIDLIQADESIIVKLLLDLYGNHILQKALVFANDKAKERMLQVISSQLTNLEQVPHGVKLKARLIANYSALGSSESTTNKSMQINNNNYNNLNNNNTSNININNNNNNYNNNNTVNTNIMNNNKNNNNSSVLNASNTVGKPLTKCNCPLNKCKCKKKNTDNNYKPNSNLLIPIGNQDNSSNIQFQNSNYLNTIPYYNYHHGINNFTGIPINNNHLINQGGIGNYENNYDTMNTPYLSNAYYDESPMLSQQHQNQQQQIPIKNQYFQYSDNQNLNPLVPNDYNNCQQSFESTPIDYSNNYLLQYYQGVSNNNNQLGSTGGIPITENTNKNSKMKSKNKKTKENSNNNNNNLIAEGSSNPIGFQSIYNNYQNPNNLINSSTGNNITNMNSYNDLSNSNNNMMMNTSYTNKKGKTNQIVKGSISNQQLGQQQMVNNSNNMNILNSNHKTHFNNNTGNANFNNYQNHPHFNNNTMFQGPYNSSYINSNNNNTNTNLYNQQNYAYFNSGNSN